MKKYAVYEKGWRVNNWLATFDRRRDAEEYAWQEKMKNDRYSLACFDAKLSFYVVEVEEKS